MVIFVFETAFPWLSSIINLIKIMELEAQLRQLIDSMCSDCYVSSAFDSIFQTNANMSFPKPSKSLKDFVYFPRDRTKDNTDKLCKYRGVWFRVLGKWITNDTGYFIYEYAF